MLGEGGSGERALGETARTLAHEVQVRSAGGLRGDEQLHGYVAVRQLCPGGERREREDCHVAAHSARDAVWVARVVQIRRLHPSSSSSLISALLHSRVNLE